MIVKFGKITGISESFVVFNNSAVIQRTALDPLIKDLSLEEILSGSYFLFVKMGFIISIGDGKQFLDLRKGCASGETVHTSELFIRA